MDENTLIMLSVGTTGAVALGYVLKRIPTGKWAKQLSELGERNGRAITAFCQRKIPLWNTIIEPVVVDTFAVFPAYVAGLIKGLKSDND